MQRLDCFMETILLEYKFAYILTLVDKCKKQSHRMMNEQIR